MRAESSTKRAVNLVQQTRNANTVSSFEIQNWVEKSLEILAKDRSCKDVFMIDNSTGQSNYWQNREFAKYHDTAWIIENEYPGMRKEIPENETFNKYGNAARLIELAEFENRGAVEVISKENVPYVAKFVTGRFVCTIKEKPTSEAKPRTNAHIDHN